MTHPRDVLGVGLFYPKLRDSWSKVGGNVLIYLASVSQLPTMSDYFAKGLGSVRMGNAELAHGNGDFRRVYPLEGYASCWEKARDVHV